MGSDLTVHSDSKRLSISQVEEALGEQDPKEALKLAVREGLQATPKTLPFPFFYDEVGSALFEQICKLPEYYLTRTEDSILRSHAEEMIGGWAVNQAPTLVELGSGSAEKTRRLISAGIARYGSLHYVPIDVSATAVEQSSKQLLRAFPKLQIDAFVGDYHSCLVDIGRRFNGPKLIVFLGSSLGNYEPESAENLLTRLAFLMDSNDRLLLGTDLAKDRRTLEAAYDDSQGVTARFNKNLITRINRELRANFVLDNFDHRATYNESASRVEMHLVSRVDQVVTVLEADLQVKFAAGESIHTENSHKYTPAELRRLADSSGFVEENSWSDLENQFRVQRWRLSTAAGSSSSGESSETGR